MNGLIFAILTCTNSMCLDSYSIRFHSAQDCTSWLTNRMGHPGGLINGRAYANGSHTVWLECDQKPTSEWQSVQPQPAPPESKSYTIAMCFKTEAAAREAGATGAPGSVPCIQMQPVVHEDGLACITELANLVAHNGKFSLARVGNEARVYVQGASHDSWIQCYATGPQ